MRAATTSTTSRSRASDGTNFSTKDVAISVTNVNEAPTVTSAATASVGENAAGTVYTVAATDPDAGTTLTYSLSGADAALFDINATTGAITFKSSPNYEAPTDAGGNNVYNVRSALPMALSRRPRPWRSPSPMSMRRQQSPPAGTASFAENGTEPSILLPPPTRMPELQ